MGVDSEYISLRDKVISAYQEVYKESLAFDLCEVNSKMRLKLSEDEVFMMAVKKIRAQLFAEQLESLDKVILLTQSSKEGAANYLKAVMAKQSLLLENLNLSKDETNAVNVAFASFSPDEFVALETVEVNEPTSDEDISSIDMGFEMEGDSFESRMARDIEERKKAHGVE